MDLGPLVFGPLIFGGAPIGGLHAAVSDEAAAGTLAAARAAGDKASPATRRASVDFERLRAFKRARRRWNGLLRMQPALFAHWA